MALQCVPDFGAKSTGFSGTRTGNKDKFVRTLDVGTTRMRIVSNIHVSYRLYDSNERKFYSSDDRQYLESLNLPKTEGKFGENRIQVVISFAFWDYNKKMIRFWDCSQYSLVQAMTKLFSQKDPSDADAFIEPKYFDIEVTYNPNSKSNSDKYALNVCLDTPITEVDPQTGLTKLHKNKVTQELIDALKQEQTERTVDQMIDSRITNPKPKAGSAPVKPVVKQPEPTVIESAPVVDNDISVIDDSSEIPF